MGMGLAGWLYFMDNEALVGHESNSDGGGIPNFYDWKKMNKFQWFEKCSNFEV